MTKRVLVLIATLALLALPSIADAETPNLHLLTEEGGSEVTTESRALEAKIAFTGGCTLIQPSRLTQNVTAPLEVRAQALKTEGCINFKEKFNKLFIRDSGKVELTAGASNPPTIEVGACKYNVQEVAGSLTIPGQVATTVSGKGKLISGSGCESEPTLTATLTLTNSGNGHTTYVTT